MNTGPIEPDETHLAKGITLVMDEDEQALGLLIETDGRRIVYEATGQMLVALWIQLRDELGDVPSRKRWTGHFRE